MSRRWLQEIMAIDGVNGVFVASGSADIIEKDNLDHGDLILKNLALRILRIFAAYRIRKKQASEIELYWQSQYILAKYSNNLLLVTFCRSPRVLALLRITINVAMSNLLEDKKFAKGYKSASEKLEALLLRGPMGELEKKLIAKLK